jgi:hypothetical protein
MGAVAMEGQALLGLGKALAMQAQPEQAVSILNQSVDVFEKVQATSHLEQAKTAIDALVKKYGQGV